ncbi:MAG: hypothetical protein ACI38U_03270 [Corynebacterium sp.]
MSDRGRVSRAQAAALAEWAPKAAEDMRQHADAAETAANIIDQEEVGE